MLPSPALVFLYGHESTKSQLTFLDLDPFFLALPILAASAGCRRNFYKIMMSKTFKEEERFIL